MIELQVSEQEKKILKQILVKYPYHFYAYGSRVKGSARKYSDLDLCYNYHEGMPSHLAVEIQGELEESNLPFVVELVNWQNMSQGFREEIHKDLVLVS